jgi:hypothetical protein
VDADDLIVKSGSTRVIPPTGPAAPLELRVKVSGRIASGSFCARPPRKRWWQALWRWLLRRPAEPNPALTR